MNELNLTKEKDFLERVSKIFVTLEMHNKVQEICAKNDASNHLADDEYGINFIVKHLDSSFTGMQKARIAYDAIIRLRKNIDENIFYEWWANPFELLPTDKFIEQYNELWLDAESIGRALGYATPKESVLKINQRNQDELDNYSVKVKMTSTDGKVYNQRVFSEEGIYIISMLANTDKAKAFRAELAKFLKQKRLEALHEAKSAGYITADKINARYRNLRLTNSEIKRLHLLLDAGVSKKDIAKLLRISVDSIRRIEKDLAELGA